jgi:hypothetical protein
MLMNRMPFTDVRVPAGWLVLRIFGALEYTENAKSNIPNVPVGK